MNLPPYQLIESENDWQKCLQVLQAEPRIALDLEANSLFAYREEVCLIQITIPTTDYIIDPLVGLDLEPLAGLLENAGIEKILHAAEYDLMLLKKQYGWQLNNLFDTMWAARILGYEKMGLASILGAEYGIKLNKKHQKANWCERPLTADKLAYAQNDTHFLLKLRDKFAEDFRQHNNWEEAQEIFREQCAVEPTESCFNVDKFWTINGVRHLNPQQKGVMKALYIYRDSMAQKRDAPHFRIFGSKTMLALAQEMPASKRDLVGIIGMTSGQIGRYGGGIVQAVAKGKKSPPPIRPKRKPRPPSAVMRRKEKLRVWRKETANKRGVESDVILSRGSMWDMATAHPRTMEELAKIQSLGPWRRNKYGADILQLLNGKRS